VGNVQSFFLLAMVGNGSGKIRMHATEKEDGSEVVANLIGRGQGLMQVLLGSKQYSMQKVHQQ
jgi:hypothetical protein